LVAYLLSSDGRVKDETSIQENLLPYADVYDTSLAQRGDSKHAADALRRFRLDCVRSARVTGGHFEERHGLQPDTDYEDIDPRGYAARRAVVRFSPTVARWMEERPELDLIEEREDGSAHYALYYTDPAWAARRVMRYLGEAIVLEPEELRQEVHKQSAALLETYEDGA
jgi:proteasome accessory factor C